MKHVISAANRSEGDAPGSRGQISPTSKKGPAGFPWRGLFVANAQPQRLSDPCCGSASKN